MSNHTCENVSTSIPTGAQAAAAAEGKLERRGDPPTSGLGRTDAGPAQPLLDPTRRTSTKSNGKHEGSASANLRVLTFNVFTGSPVPYVRNGTPALAGSKRLGAQLEAVAALDADILCLQEVCC